MERVTTLNRVCWATDQKKRNSFKVQGKAQKSKEMKETITRRNWSTRTKGDGF